MAERKQNGGEATKKRGLRQLPNAMGITDEEVREAIRRGEIEQTQRDVAEHTSTVVAKTAPLRDPIDWTGGLDTWPRMEPIRDEGSLIRVGEYVMHEKIGGGKYGAVYKAYAEDDREKRTPYAIKVISGLGRQNTIERSIQEAKLLAQHTHPHVARIHKVGKSDHELYFVMRHEESDLRSFRQTLETAETRKRSQAVAHLGIQMCEGMEQVNKYHIHRDLKPDNVLLTPDGQAVIADAGLARQLSYPDQFTSEAGQIVGTPAYAAPEALVKEGSEISTKADVYGVGATLYFLLTGKEPLYRPGMRMMGLAEEAQKSISSRIKSFRIRRDITRNLKAVKAPEKLRTAILWALQPRAEERATMAELRQVLTEAERSMGSGFSRGNDLMESLMKAHKRLEMERNRGNQPETRSPQLNVDIDDGEDIGHLFFGSDYGKASSAEAPVGIVDSTRDMRETREQEGFRRWGSEDLKEPVQTSGRKAVSTRTDIRELEESSTSGPGAVIPLEESNETDEEVTAEEEEAEELHPKEALAILEGLTSNKKKKTQKRRASSEVSLSDEVRSYTRQIGNDSQDPRISSIERELDTMQEGDIFSQKGLGRFRIKKISGKEIECEALDYEPGQIKTVVFNRRDLESSSSRIEFIQHSGRQKTAERIPSVRDIMLAQLDTLREGDQIIERDGSRIQVTKVKDGVVRGYYFLAGSKKGKPIELSLSNLKKHVDFLLEIITNVEQEKHDVENEKDGPKGIMDWIDRVKARDIIEGKNGSRLVITAVDGDMVSFRRLKADGTRGRRKTWTKQELKDAVDTMERFLPYHAPPSGLDDLPREEGNIAKVTIAGSRFDFRIGKEYTHNDEIDPSILGWQRINLSKEDPMMYRVQKEKLGRLIQEQEKERGITNPQSYYRLYVDALGSRITAIPRESRRDRTGHKRSVHLSFDVHIDKIVAPQTEVKAA